jgi:hypothetical protein
LALSLLPFLLFFSHSLSFSCEQNTTMCYLLIHCSFSGMQDGEWKFCVLIPCLHELLFILTHACSCLAGCKGAEVRDPPPTLPLLHKGPPISCHVEARMRSLFNILCPQEKTFAWGNLHRRPAY